MYQTNPGATLCNDVSTKIRPNVWRNVAQRYIFDNVAPECSDTLATAERGWAPKLSTKRILGKLLGKERPLTIEIDSLAN